jgi:tumor protein p53-inducible protein 3
LREKIDLTQRRKGAKMKALLVENKTQNLYIGESPDPIPSENELLVRVKATALNRADLLQKQGHYPPPPGASTILGLEMAGVVEQVGNGVKKWKPGDRVCALLPGGGYAELVAVPSDMAIPIPDNLSFEEAAAIPEVFLTAYLCLFKLGNIKPTYTVLIHAGASGVGTAAIQLAREVGATAIATASTEAKRAACVSLGASLAIPYKDTQFDEEVRKATNNKGVNIILDSVGASHWQRNMNSLATDGRLVIIATMGGGRVEMLDLRQILSRRLQIIGSTLRARALEEKIELTSDFSEFALTRFADGRLVPIIDKIWDWKEVKHAHDYMEENKNIGKLVLTIK